MSINRSENLSGSGSYIFRDYSVSGGSDESVEQEKAYRRRQQSFNDIENYDFYSLTPSYVIPFATVKSKVFSVDQKIRELLNTYEDLLFKVYLNPNLDNDIEEAHYHIFDEIKEDGQEIDKVPNFISFAQYLYAERHGCRGCRRFVKEYDRLISHSVFVHLFDFRYYLTLLANESSYIKNSLLYDFGGEYEDESQEQTAAFYYSWSKMAENHTRLLTEELAKQGEQLPSSEVDIITKKQAAQFQAFFSIRVASYTEAIDNILFSLKKDLFDHCENLYMKHISPSLKFKTHVAAPLQLDIQTTNMSTVAPFLAEEVVTAVSAMRGNFGSLLSDMVQRRNLLKSKFERLLSLNLQRRKYISFIDQLAIKGSSRPKITISVDEDPYSLIFENINVDLSERSSLKSSHANLDGLLEDHHPQYLLRGGGNIFGDISVDEGVTIDGVDLNLHAHTGNDGSAKIKSTDIDYDTPREDAATSETTINDSISVNLTGFAADVRVGGVPVSNAIIEINIPDEVKDVYEFEVLYTEVE